MNIFTKPNPKPPETMKKPAQGDVSVFSLHLPYNKDTNSAENPALAIQQVEGKKGIR